MALSKRHFPRSELTVSMPTYYNYERSCCEFKPSPLFLQSLPFTILILADKKMTVLEKGFVWLTGKNASSSAVLAQAVPAERFMVLNACTGKVQTPQINDIHTSMLRN